MTSIQTIHNLSSFKGKFAPTVHTVRVASYPLEIKKDNTILFGTHSGTRRYHKNTLLVTFNALELPFFLGKNKIPAKTHRVLRLYEGGGLYVGDVLQTTSLKNGEKITKTVKNGQGSYYGVNGSLYTGHYKDNLKDGTGHYTSTTWSSFEWDYKHGLRHGRGVKIELDGSTFTGEYVHGKREGQGTYKGIQSTYQGTYKNGLRHGQGTYKNPKSHDNYKWDYINGRRLDWSLDDEQERPDDEDA